MSFFNMMWISFKTTTDFLKVEIGHRSFNKPLKSSIQWNWTRIASSLRKLCLQEGQVSQCLSRFLRPTKRSTSNSGLSRRSRGRGTWDSTMMTLTAQSDRKSRASLEMERSVRRMPLVQTIRASLKRTRAVQSHQKCQASRLIHLGWIWGCKKLQWTLHRFMSSCQT